MCGIVGLSLSEPRSNAPKVLAKMSDLIAHRGPDSDGYFATTNELTHLGFRRLAIRDLNPRANQPMTSASGRTAIVFNGEVYNSQELADRYLDGLELRTSGDTEVVLETIERHGFDVLSELNGMFAIAALDIASGRLSLIRDRMGMKPLYLYEDTGLLAFSSELRSLKPFGLRIDPSNSNLYFHFGYFPSPHTFYDRTTQVCPGEVVEVERGEIQSRRFFHRFSDSTWSRDSLALDDLDSTLQNATELRQLSDVPLGAFLSGGVDSALVAAFLKDGANGANSAVPTYTIAFRDQDHNEASQAAATAAELSLPHTTIEIQEHDLAKLAANFQDCYEQPYADTSGLVTMLLCDAVKQHVTVALSGDGGDEFFGGYARYDWYRKALLAQRSPALLRRVAAWAIARTDQQRGRRLARWLTAADPAALYAEVMRMWNATDMTQLLAPECSSVTANDFVRDVFSRVDADPLAQASCFDAMYYIPDDLQVKLDRASMRVALEVRCPLLDYRVANLGRRLRTDLKYQHGLKTTLKQLLGRHVSPEVLRRPKHGFSVPLARWLQGPMKTCVADTLGQQVLRETGWLDHKTAMQVWEDFMAGESKHATSVWMLFSMAQHLKEPKQDPMFATLCRSTKRRAA